MALIKREYTEQETTITAENLNDIQDAVIALEDGLFSVENDKSGEIITITDAAKRGFRSFNIYGKTTQNGTPTPDAPVDMVSIGDGGIVAINITGKNILPYPYTNTSKVSNGITFTDNGDGSITIDGTASAETYFYLNTNKLCGDTVINGMNAPNGATDGKYAISYLLFYNGVNGTLSVNILKGATFNNKTIYPQVELGSSATAYEPYKGQTCSVSTPGGLRGIPVTSGGNYTDANGHQWVCDEIDFARGVYVQRVGTKVFDGSRDETWNVYEYPSYEGYYHLIEDMAVGRQQSGYCDKIPVHTHSEQSLAIWLGVNSNIMFVHNALDLASNLDSWKAWLAENPITVQYIKATPIETILPEEELAAYAALHTYKDRTTVSNDAIAWMELEYVMDAKKYIDSLMTGSIIPATVE